MVRSSKTVTNCRLNCPYRIPARPTRAQYAYCLSRLYQIGEGGTRGHTQSRWRADATSASLPNRRGARRDKRVPPESPRSPARDERPPPRDRISPTGGARSVASVRGNPNGTFHPPTRRPRRLPPCNLAKTDCGVARYSGRRSHIGLCQIRVCAASAFPRRTRQARPSRFHRRTRQARPSRIAAEPGLPYPHEPRPARSTI